MKKKEALEIRIANLEEEIKTKTFELQDAEYSLKKLREADKDVH